MVLMGRPRALTIKATPSAAFSLTAARSLKAAATTALRFRRPSAGRADCRTGRDESASSGAGGDSRRAVRRGRLKILRFIFALAHGETPSLGEPRRRSGVEALSGRTTN